MPSKLTEDVFIERARILHGGKYDYSLVNYINAKTKVTVICPEHGQFSIRAGRHITIRRGRGEIAPQGCPACWRASARWTHEEVKEIASRYRYRADFQRHEKGAYLYALRNASLEDVCAHMDRQIAAKGHWLNKENCREEAIKYSQRTDFMRNSGSAYGSALRNGWLDEICSHMEKGADSYHYVVYVILNEGLNKVYIGITKQHLSQRLSGHLAGGSTRAKEIVGIEGAIFVRCTDYEIDSTDVRSAESAWAAKYQKDGCHVLNSMKQYGKIGVSRRVYTDDIIEQEAQKYKTRSEFKARSPRHYDAALSQRILDRVCSHMRGIAQRNYWTFERCLEYASTCETRDDFAKSANGAYSSARSNGWLSDIYRLTGLRSKLDMTWLSPGARIEIWSRADEFYEIWTSSGKCTYTRMNRITGVNLHKLILKFERGWNPLVDREWMKWSATVKGT